MTPFIIHALGRSRTAWLSSFLTHGAWKCWHESALYMRSMEDFYGFLRRPLTGTAETGAALAWPLIKHANPSMKTVVIRRDVREATNAMAETYRRAGIPFDADKLASVFARADKALDKLTLYPDTLSVDYEDLSTKDGCKKVFEFCLGEPLPDQRWLDFKDRQIEVDLRQVVAYYWANREGIENFKRICKTELVRLVRSGALKDAVN